MVTITESGDTRRAVADSVCPPETSSTGKVTLSRFAPLRRSRATSVMAKELLSSGNASAFEGRRCFCVVPPAVISAMPVSATSRSLTV